MTLATHTDTVLTRAQWQDREHAHHERADALTAGRRDRAARGQTHPVDDFLYTYYSYKPGLLRRWHPGAGVELADAADTDRSAWRWYRPGAGGGSLRIDAAGFAAAKSDLLSLCERMLRLTAARTPRFGCFGLHEWAMVYRAPEARHAVPLRLGQAGTDDVVDAHELRCTHIDAFRFFTDDAVPRNRFIPTRADQPLREQPGCLHAGMDVYKWAMKLGPLVPGELMLDAFELARDIRALDMAASPYDLADWGVTPVAIETAEGKAEYVRQQRGFTERGNALRTAILDAWRPVQSAG
ncbi:MULTISPECIES: 3-methyladenine DNA glycosylase [unclassified Microbacterium]|uniref:3-methyladenine DNA glycosylase n=1 Tax=unclassified Microbacterium TaxID=2609290 RepID=UPI00214C0D8A|nr:MULTISPECIES: 3-methyladenine DNA glycosylase [unclassified Microbacterium]MCR2785546.1 3-methyladenine DNA glycosylase [Microbacterium sp. zg.B96]WIM17466.1 3-methyladenine DNA glycosylase [Microbacterium sp. zg-B96]